jgi:hypothetical protein
LIAIRKIAEGKAPPRKNCGGQAVAKAGKKPVKKRKTK